jgi:hypothetical protein
VNVATVNIDHAAGRGARSAARQFSTHAIGAVMGLVCGQQCSWIQGDLEA